MNCKLNSHHDKKSNFYLISAGYAAVVSENCLFLQNRLSSAFCIFEVRSSASVKCNSEQTKLKQRKVS